MLSAWHDIHFAFPKTFGLALLFTKAGLHFFGYNNVYWSLAPEAIFYLLVPLAFWKVRAYYVLSALFFLFAVLFAPAHDTKGIFAEYLFYYNGYFALGAAVYDLITTRPRWLLTFRQMSGAVLLVGLGGLSVALIVSAALHLRAVSGPLAGLLAVLSISVLLAGRISRQNLGIRFFHEVGIFSFSLYLYHFPLLILCYVGLVSLTGNLANYPRYYWLALPLVTAACYALYYVTERPAVRFFRGR